MKLEECPAGWSHDLNKTGPPAAPVPSMRTDPEP